MKNLILIYLSTKLLFMGVVCGQSAKISKGEKLQLTSQAKNDKLVQGTSFMEEKLILTDAWDKTFHQSEHVRHRKVTFHNRYGITLAADLYEPKEATQRLLPAIAVCGPFGAVKEQCSGLYAQAMAERGFLAMAFDPSFTGESGGQPRYVASPDINTEDFQAAVDFLCTKANVDTHKIGLIGICGWGGFALNAAALDTRVKATVASTMYDMTRVTAKGYFDAEDSEEARYAKREALCSQRIEDYKTGTYKLAGGVIDPLPAEVPSFVKDYYDYYKTPRGYHERSLNSNGGWNVSSSSSFLNMPILQYSHEIRSAVLLVHGEKAHSCYFSRDAFKKLRGYNKELLLIPNAVHTDLYDNKKVIPFDFIADFFKKHFERETKPFKVELAQDVFHQTAGRDTLHNFAPQFAALNDDVLFGEVWSRRDKLSLKTRSIVTLSALISKGITDSSLKHHLELARKHGVTKDEMAEILTQLAFYAGWPNAWAAFRMAKEIYADDVEAQGHGGFFGQGEPNTQYAQYFTGKSYLKRLTNGQNGVAIANVTFEPACRNHWHVHKASKGGGQILLCIEGEGWYQQEGQAAQALKPGDVIVIPANVKHWHGAQANSWFSHLAVECPGENTSTEWLEPVLESSYLSLEPMESKK